jgi:hypothetical protein
MSSGSQPKASRIWRVQRGQPDDGVGAAQVRIIGHPGRISELGRLCRSRRSAARLQAGFRRSIGGLYRQATDGAIEGRPHPSFFRLWVLTLDPGILVPDFYLPSIQIAQRVYFQIKRSEWHPKYLYLMAPREPYLRLRIQNSGEKGLTESHFTSPSQYGSPEVQRGDVANDTLPTGPNPGSESVLRKTLAERVGFEPTIRFPVYTLSKRAPSATRPPLRARRAQYNDGPRRDNPRGTDQFSGCGRPRRQRRNFLRFASLISSP